MLAKQGGGVVQLYRYGGWGGGGGMCFDAVWLYPCDDGGFGPDVRLIEQPLADADFISAED